MKYSGDMGSIYKPIFIKTGSGIQEFIRGIHIQTHADTQTAR
jgi:hypothetical protein